MADSPGRLPASEQYSGDAGAEYFTWQRTVGILGARLNAWKFLPHLEGAEVVVDFGCGMGALLASLPARRRLGVEPNPVAAAEARLHGIEVYGSAADLPAEVADAVISNHALEHTLHPLGELAALRRALKPGGKLVLWLPFDDFRREPKDCAADVNHHLYTWSPLLLFNLLREAGFEVRDVRMVTHAWPPKAALLSRLPRPLWDALCFAMSVARCRRQVAAVALRPLG